MSPRHHLVPKKQALLCAAAALALPLAAGCGGSGDSKKPEPASLQELAEQTNCSVTGKRKVADMEQGNCKNDLGRYVLVSFSSDKKMNTWLEEAKPWGGAYLVGASWIVVSEQKTLETIRKDLGGKIVHGDDHSWGDGNGGHGNGGNGSGGGHGGGEHGG
ncbi:hypothetical protein [Actinomadura sp. 7K534]|uniref:hypothetical protein n=1 Tax=Actinomadura sp. 7K534 TaxID=2530366 RepID=UPI0010490189|nr:hypothetical protein [Actinomadura sp. 7K534]TDB95418.1 hypothetical protein E1266_13290 [Actinomadura sp. 7K534]